MKYLDGLNWLNSFIPSVQKWIMENVVNPLTGYTFKQELANAPYVGNFPCAVNPSYRKAAIAAVRAWCKQQKMPFKACFMNKKILQ